MVKSSRGYATSAGGGGEEDDIRFCEGVGNICIGRELPKVPPNNKWDRQGGEVSSDLGRLTIRDGLMVDRGMLNVSRSGGGGEVQATAKSVVPIERDERGVRTYLEGWSIGRKRLCDWVQDTSFFFGVPGR